jgi:hypothetical protein
MISAWARRLARAFGRKPRSVKWEDIAITTYRHLLPRRTWRKGAERRILKGARRLDGGMSTAAAIDAIRAIVEAEITGDRRHA